MSRNLMNQPAPKASDGIGPLTGRWFERKVLGKWARTEYWLVGLQYDRFRYTCSNNGNPEFSGRFGHLYIESNLLSNKGLKMIQYGTGLRGPGNRSKYNIQWVVVCDECDNAPEFDPYVSKFVCECGKQQVTERKGKWYTCAECTRRFKSMDPEFLCPECVDFKE